MTNIKDDLEKFVTGNRDQFDELEPGKRVWDKIENHFGGKSNFNWKKTLLQAAAVVVIFICSYYMHDFIDRRSDNKYVSAKDTVSNKEIKELIESEAYYNAQIDVKKNELFKLASYNPEIKLEIESEFSELDSMYVQLKKDLKENMSNEQVIEAMIQNYRMKLQILEDMLYEIKSKQNNMENNKRQQYEI